MPALGIAVEIMVESKANNLDCNGKPDPQGNAQILYFKSFQKRLILNKLCGSCAIKTI